MRATSIGDVVKTFLDSDRDSVRVAAIEAAGAQRVFDTPPAVGSRVLVFARVLHHRSTDPWADVLRLGGAMASAQVYGRSEGELVTYTIPTPQEVAHLAVGVPFVIEAEVRSYYGPTLDRSARVALRLQGERARMLFDGAIYLLHLPRP